jgi:hypothetical protein
MKDLSYGWYEEEQWSWSVPPHKVKRWWKKRKEKKEKGVTGVRFIRNSRK